MDWAGVGTGDGSGGVGGTGDVLSAMGSMESAKDEVEALCRPQELCRKQHAIDFCQRHPAVRTVPPLAG